MPWRSQLFEFVIIGVVTALYALAQNIFGNQIYDWLKLELEKRTGALEGELLANLSQVFFSLVLAIGIVWTLYRYLERELRAEFVAERDHDRRRLWQLRQQGIALRNRGLTTLATTEWERNFKTWRAAILRQAELVSLNLMQSLDPLDKVTVHERTQHPDPDHQKLVSVTSEILIRIKDYLDRTHYAQ